MLKNHTLSINNRRSLWYCLKLLNYRSKLHPPKFYANRLTAYQIVTSRNSNCTLTLILTLNGKKPWLQGLS